MFLILFRNRLCPQQMFPSLRAQGNVMSNNAYVSATMCPRLPPPQELPYLKITIINEHIYDKKVQVISFLGLS